MGASSIVCLPTLYIRLTDDPWVGRHLMEYPYGQDYAQRPAGRAPESDAFSFHLGRPCKELHSPTYTSNGVMADEPARASTHTGRDCY